MSHKEYPYRNSFSLVDIQKGKVLSFLRFLNYVVFLKKKIVNHRNPEEQMYITPYRILPTKDEFYQHPSCIF